MQSYLKVTQDTQEQTNQFYITFIVFSHYRACQKIIDKKVGEKEVEMNAGNTQTHSIDELVIFISNSL